MEPGLPQTIRGQFALFALSIALPLVALIGYRLYDRTRDDIAAAEAIAQRLAESNADRVAEYVAGLRATLEAVARRPLVRAMDAARCDPRLAELVDLYPRAGSLIVVDREGAILCSSRPLPRDRVMRIKDEELLGAMLADPRFRVSRPLVGTVSGRWIVSAVQPVFGEGSALAGFVSMATDLAQWRSISPPEALPAGAIVTVVTSGGTIVARSAEAEKWINRQLWDERLMQSILKSAKGAVRAEGPDGTERIFGVSPVAGLPWFVFADLPEESVFAAARERLVQTGALLALAVAIVIALAWVFLTRLSKPIRAIAEAVGARAEGDEEARIPVAGPVEIANVARELNRMIESGERDARELARQAGRVKRHAGELESANRQLRESERRYSDLLGNVQLISVMLDREARITYCNEYLLRLTGWRNEEIIGRSWVELFIPPEISNFKERLAVLFSDQPAGRHGENYILTRSGERRLIRWNNSLLRSAAGDVIGLASIGEDITERTRAAQEIRDLNASLEQRVAERTAQLEAANKELEAFSYSVSHDLRAPLRAIDGFSRIVQEDYAGKLDDEGQRLLGVIRDNSQKMGRLIDDLLEYSRLGRKSLSNAEIDMQRLVEEVLGELQISGERPPRLEMKALPPARGDAVLVKQAWANLLGNAVKFSSKREQSAIEVSGRENGAENIYCVKDNGAGFDMKYYDKLFGMFQRLHSTEEFEGTGVGLAIVQRVVARHGGRVWAEGKLGEGAAFYFSPSRGEALGRREIGHRRVEEVAERDQ